MSHQITHPPLIVGDMSTLIPNPSSQHVATWMQKVTPTYLQNEGWHEANNRFHGIVSAARAYAQDHFAGQLEQQEAFFDGIALSLSAICHFADVERIKALLEAKEVTADDAMRAEAAAEAEAQAS